MDVMQDMFPGGLGVIVTKPVYKGQARKLIQPMIRHKYSFVICRVHETAPELIVIRQPVYGDPAEIIEELPEGLVAVSVYRSGKEVK